MPFNEVDVWKTSAIDLGTTTQKTAIIILATTRTSNHVKSAC